MEKKPKLLVAFNTVEEAYKLFETKFDVVRPPKGRDFTKEEIIKLLGDFDALGSVFDIPIDDEIIKAGGDKLKIVANYAVGYNNIDLDAAKKNGLAVTNTPKTVVAPTAELVMALMLSASRRIAEQDALMLQYKENLKMTRIDCLGIDLAGKTLGVIGFGNIGKAVAERAKAFGMNVLYNKRNSLTKEEEEHLGVNYASVDEIFRNADVVTLHTPLTPETKHLASRERIFAMKNTAILVNASRGAVVDEEALVDALENGRIMAAALDVFENSDKPNPKLYKLPNVVMTPHVGTQTYDARLDMAKELFDNLVGFFFKNGEGVAFVVDPR